MATLEGLSLNADDWRQMAEVLGEVRWQTTRLNIRYQDSVPASAGIYLMVTDERQLSHRYCMPQCIASVIYVGQSRSLRERFKQHAAASPPNPNLYKCRLAFGDLRYIFALAPDLAESQLRDWLNLVEATLVKVLSPPANRNVPRGPSLSATLGTPQAVG